MRRAVVRRIMMMSMPMSMSMCMRNERSSL